MCRAVQTVANGGVYVIKIRPPILKMPSGKIDLQLRGLRDLGYESLVLHLEALSDQEEDEALETIEATLGAPDYRSPTALAWNL